MSNLAPYRTAPDPAGPDPVHRQPMHALTLAALGVVYGDIGTSPIYTLRECTTMPHGVGVSAPNILGILSLVFWALTLVVTFKYITVIMRADNKGEGGILALLALLPAKMRAKRPGHIGLIALLVVAGAGLLYGDGVITPAISVLSAVEGLEVATPRLASAVLPITVVILIGLFLIQKHGTARVGRLFGPVMVVWFSTLAFLGVFHILHGPRVLAAVSPHYAVRFFAAHKLHGFRLLGSVVLAVTGGEALYADMGHFGRAPIKRAWMWFVLPALLLSYFGQGAHLLSHPDAHPFFSLVPAGVFTYALVVLAGLATIIASQALISGAFSLTQQAVQLGYFPRVTIVHTSTTTEGQIYIPEINWALAIGCILLVLTFQSSSRLAAAYGIAVTGTMVITSISFYVVAKHTLGWRPLTAAALLALFLAIDVPFLLANLLKFFHGGYVPVLIAAGVTIIMVTWRIGRSLLGEHYRERSPSWDSFLAECDEHLLVRIPGVAVVLASNVDGVPPLLVQHLRRIRAIHSKVIVMTVVFEHVPFVDPSARYEIEEIGKGFFRLKVQEGFMEDPDVPGLLAEVFSQHQIGVAGEVTYYLGRETFLATEAGKMGAYSESLFAFLVRNSRSATEYFKLPPEQVLEIGVQIDL